MRLCKAAKPGLRKASVLKPKKQTPHYVSAAGVICQEGTCIDGATSVEGIAWGHVEFPMGGLTVILGGFG